MELERLKSCGIISPVRFADWAAPIVPVVKEDGTVRICGDYKLTINRVVRLESYLSLELKSFFTALSGGISFSKLDLTNAYLQLLLDN